MNIPTQLQNPAFRFVLIDPNEPTHKKPIGYCWSCTDIEYEKQNDNTWKNKITGEIAKHRENGIDIPFISEKLNSYSFNNPSLISHEGNVGILTGRGLIILDCDKPEAEEISRHLPETLTISTSMKTNTYRGKHFYYYCPLEKKIILKTEDIQYGEIQSTGQQCVCPPSIHLSRIKYEITHDAPIATITEKELFDAISHIMITKELQQKIDREETDKICAEIKSRYKISQLLSHYGIDITKNPTQCPWHDSQHGQNLSYNNTNGTWHCFHCEKSGSIFHFVQMQEKCNFIEAKKKLAILAGVKQKREEIRLPKEGRLISEFVIEVADVLKNENILFFRSDAREIVEIGKIKNEKEQIYTGFVEISPSRLITLVEDYFIPGYIIAKKTDDVIEFIFKTKSITRELANTTLHSPMLEKRLLNIDRIFTFPLPIIIDNKLCFPKKGYDENFNSWLPYSTPQIKNENMSLEDAKTLIHYILSEFCFKEKRDETHAIAGLITPFLRGLYNNLNDRTPVFIYIANRERVGKDYLANINGLLYEGFALEEPPISNSEAKSSGDEELRKKILSAFISGRKRLHFSNNRGHINNGVFEAIITAKTWSDRLLGKNISPIFSNELEFSLSGNFGVTFTADLANRSRVIHQFLDIEDANSREFKNPNLHAWVLERRDEILSALYALVKNWVEKGCPAGKTPFASFPEWARVCGGIMESAGYDSPCEIEKETSSISGDTETNNMKKVFELCYEKYLNKSVSKQDIKNVVYDENIQGADIFSDFNFQERADQIKFGMLIQKYEGRILSNIRMSVANSDARHDRIKYFFSKIDEKPEKKEKTTKQTQILDSTSVSETDAQLLAKE